MNGTAIPASPYKGLASFGDSELDGQLFFGRERDTEIVVANLLAARLTVLYGASGVGKSSLLRASVARRLRAEPNTEAIVVSSWSGDATAPLRAAQDAADGGRDAYLILDQFEEYFLYHADEEGERAMPEALAEMLGRSHRRVNVLISVREDSLARLGAFKAQVPNVLANYLRLPHLDREAGRAAIVGPLRRWSELAGAAQRVEIEPALVEAVLDGTAAGEVEFGGTGGGGDESGEGQIEAPILQLVLERLWQAEREQGSRLLRLETFIGLGGAAAIVRDHLERALDALTPAQQDVAASMFDHLVTPSGSKIALRAADLADYAGVGAAGVEPVLATLGRERILRSVEGRGGDAERYEIFHDVLADAVLAWSAERRLERTQQAAERRHRRLLAVAVASIAALAFVTAVAVFALVERHQAQSHERQAKARELEASALLGLPLGADNSLLLALRAARLEPGARSEDVLRRALVESRLRVSLPASGPAHLLEFTSDGRRLLVAGGSSRILLYDPDTGRLTRTFQDPATVTAGSLGPGGLLLSGDADGHVQLRNTSSGAVLSTLRGRGAVTSAVFAPGGRLFLFTTRGGTAEIRRADGELVHVLPQPGPVAQGAFNPAGTLVATIAKDAQGHHSRARVYDALTGKLLHVLPLLGVEMVAFSPDGSLLATGSHSGVVALWRPRTGRRVQLLGDGGRFVHDLAFTPDGTLLATASEDGATRIWDVARGTRLYLFPGHSSAVVDVAWSADGRLLADASLDRTARIYAVQGDRLVVSLIATLPGNVGGTIAVAFDPLGVLVATGGVERGVRLWDASPDERLVPLGVHDGAVATAAYSPSGALAVSAGADGSVKIWDVKRHAAVRTLRMAGPVVDASFSPNGELVLAASEEGIARLWSVADWSPVRDFGGSSSPLRLARFSGDGSLVVTAAADGSVRLWRVRDGRELHVLRPGGPVTDAAFSPDGETLATASSSGAALWLVADGRLLARLPVPGGVLRVAFSPDGRLLATADERGTATLWEVPGGRKVHVLRGHRPGTSVTDVVFSSDGKALLTIGADADGRTWAIPSGAPLQLLRGQFGTLNAGAFSPDGRWIATAGPTTAVLWPAATGQLLFYLRGHVLPVTAVSFSPDGKQVLTASEDGSVRVYDCALCGDLASLEALADARLARSRLGS